MVHCLHQCGAPNSEGVANSRMTRRGGAFVNPVAIFFHSEKIAFAFNGKQFIPVKMKGHLRVDA